MILSIPLKRIRVSTTIPMAPSSLASAMHGSAIGTTSLSTIRPLLLLLLWDVQKLQRTSRKGKEKRRIGTTSYSISTVFTDFSSSPLGVRRCRRESGTRRARGASSRIRRYGMARQRRGRRSTWDNRPGTRPLFDRTPSEAIASARRQSSFSSHVVRRRGDHAATPLFVIYAG